MISFHTGNKPAVNFFLDKRALVRANAAKPASIGA